MLKALINVAVYITSATSINSSGTPKYNAGAIIGRNSIEVARVKNLCAVFICYISLFSLFIYQLVKITYHWQYNTSTL